MGQARFCFPNRNLVDIHAGGEIIKLMGKGMPHDTIAQALGKTAH